MFSFLRRFGTPEVDLAELDALLEDGSIRILDVGEDTQFRSGQVGAANIRLVKRLPDRLGKLKRRALRGDLRVRQAKPRGRQLPAGRGVRRARYPCAGPAHGHAAAGLIVR